MLDLNLTSKRALVCGASQGIGAACAKELADLGCEIIALARSEDKLKNLLNDLSKKKQQNHSYLIADTADLKALEAIIQTEIKSNGAIDIWINNTGGPAPGPILEATLEQFQMAFDMHLKA